MSVLFEDYIFKLEKCSAPKSHELPLLRDAGLNPTEWLVLRGVSSGHYLLLQRKGVSSLRAVLRVRGYKRFK